VHIRPIEGIPLLYVEEPKLSGVGWLFKNVLDRVLALLGLLESGPLHPYGMQQLIRQWGKDQVVNVGQRASLYKMISRLLEAGLIRERETTRDSQYPERTTYELTDAGRAASRQWLDEILSTPRNEFPEFPAALAFLPILPPDEVRSLLERRLIALEEKLAGIAGQAPPGLPRLFLIEDEYRTAMLRAELEWVRALVRDLSEGRLTWDAAMIQATLEQFG